MSTIELQAYDILKIKLCEKEAKTLMDYFDSKAEQKFVEKKDVILTKDDKIDLVTKIESSKTNIIKWMFVFWIAQLASTFTFILLYLKKG